MERQQHYTVTVNALDTISPVITLNGASEVTLTVDGTYDELGATVTDNYDTNLTATINASMVNTTVVGSYTVTYDAVDTAGNNAIQVTRTVNVIAALSTPAL